MDDRCELIITEENRYEPVEHIKRLTFAGDITVVLKSATDVSAYTRCPGTHLTQAYPMERTISTSVVYGNVAVANSTYSVVLKQ